MFFINFDIGRHFYRTTEMDQKMQMRRKIEIGSAGERGSWDRVGRMCGFRLFASEIRRGFAPELCIPFQDAGAVGVCGQPVKGAVGKGPDFSGFGCAR